MSEHRIYSGEELLRLPPGNDKPLIQDILWEKDNVMLVGKDKTGKSILALQIAFCISSGEAFLGDYAAAKNCVLYIQLEGKDTGKNSMQQRVISMMEGVSFDTTNFNWFYLTGLPLNRAEGFNFLTRSIDEKISVGMPIPKLIIIDPLYMSMKGDLSNQEEATNMCTNFRKLVMKYQCAMLIVHHEHKAKYNKDGKSIDEDDTAFFGSFAWKAFVDHLFVLRKKSGGYRELTCGTQRGREIIDKVELTLLEPVPLMFEVKSNITPFMRVVEKHLQENRENLSIEEICSRSKMDYGCVQRALTNLRKTNKVVCLNKVYPKQWRLK